MITSYVKVNPDRSVVLQELEIFETIDEEGCGWNICKEPKKEGFEQLYTIIRTVEDENHCVFTGFGINYARELIDIAIRLIRMGCADGAYAMLEAEAQEYSEL